METRTDKTNRRPGRCRKCGRKLNPGQGYLIQISYFPWDGSDTEGSIAKTRWDLECIDPEECKNHKRAMREIREMQDKSDDLIARESGLGTYGKA